MPTEWVELHLEAGMEFDAAFEWYMERSPDAALRFDAEVDRALTQLVSAPKRWAAGPHSRFLLRQFSYMLIYRERASIADIQIVAVAHTSRRQGYWKTPAVATGKIFSREDSASRCAR